MSYPKDNRFGIGLLLASWLLICGCQTRSTEQNWVRTEVYFGLSKPDGTLVPLADWEAFVEEEVTPRFPAGLSILDASGQWKGAAGKIEKEQSKVLVLLHPRGPKAQREIDSIRAAYRTRFHQEAVMEVTTRARVSFLEPSIPK